MRQKLWGVVALTLVSLAATMATVPAGPVSATSTTDCQGWKSEPTEALAQYLFNRECGGRFDYESGHHKCDWFNGSDPGWRCSGPRGEQPGVPKRPATPVLQADQNGIHWATSPGSPGASGYEIHRNGTFWKAVRSTRLAISSDEAGTFTVVAFNSVGQYSGHSNQISGPADDPLDEPARPNGGACSSMQSFVIGCDASSGPWTPAFATYMAQTGLAAPGTNVGARAQIISDAASAPSTERVLYILGPYLPAEGENDDHDSVAAEFRAVRALAPAVGQAAQRASDAGVTVVYIGFGDAPDAHLPVASRVRATKSAMRAFENLRRTNGAPRNESMVIGVSLGGVVGKIALRELEDEGYDHGVDTYLSFDSPHHGAYVPHALQYVPIFMRDSFNWFDGQIFGISDDPEDASDQASEAIEKTLKNPVAQDLLIANMAYPDQRSPNINYLWSRYGRLPSSTYNVAVASGAIDGTAPFVQPELLTVNTGKAGRNDLKLSLAMNVTVPRTDQVTTSFSGDLSYLAALSGFFQINKRQYYRRALSVSPRWAVLYDRAPCAHSTEVIRELRSVLRTGLQSTWGNPSIVGQAGACFIPTYSAVIGSIGADGRAVVGSSAFDQVIGDSTNKEHLKTSTTMDAQIMQVVDETFDGHTSPSLRSKKSDSWTVNPPEGGTIKSSMEVTYEDGSGQLVDAAELQRLGLNG